jgi:hypothetical protein
MRLLSSITEVFGNNEPVTAQLPTHEIDELLLLSSWFRRFPGELQRTSARADAADMAVAS